ncbi:hypothetical protein BOX15_Mlig020158g1, partial [Macrostomum lignano]
PNAGAASQTASPSPARKRSAMPGNSSRHGKSRHHHRHHREHRDSSKRHRRDRSPSHSSSDGSDAKDRNGGSRSSDIHLSRIGNEQDRERRVAEIEADDGFRPAAFVSSRSRGGGGTSSGGGGASSGGYAKMMNERGHDSAIFGRGEEAGMAAAAAAMAEAEEAATATAGETTEAVRVREILHPLLTKDLVKAWEEYRTALLAQLRLRRSQ